LAYGPALLSGIISTNDLHAFAEQPNVRTRSALVQVAVDAALIR